MRGILSLTTILIVFIGAFDLYYAFDISTFEFEENDSDFNFDDIDFESPPFIANNVTDEPIDKNIEEDSKLDTPGLIKKYGYNAETHFVTTQDGYILRLHRIAGGPSSPPRPGKKVVFYMHGTLDSSAGIILSGPGKALGYLLADNDYDVWLGNSRGNVYSTDHISLNPHGSRKDQKKFWSHSFHEIGYYDVPASIDFVLSKTNQTKLQYIGHSQGAAAFFVMASQRPEYNNKIEMAHALAPAVLLSHCKSPLIRAVVPFLKYIIKLKNFIGMNYFSPPKWLRTLAGSTLCKKSAKTQIICEGVIFLLAGWDSDQLNKTMIPVYMGHAGAGSSTDTFVHLGQGVKSGLFRQFDHGWFKNLWKYHRTSPPEYNLKNVKAPVALYYSKNDWLTSYEDVERLVPRLPNVKNSYLVPHEKFNHLDFLWGRDARQLLYKEIIKTMKSNDDKP